MSGLFGKDLLDQLIEQGEKDQQEQLGEKLNDALSAVGRVFAAVKSGKLDVSVLENLAQWAENPNQGVNGQQRPKALGSQSSDSDRFDAIAKTDPTAAANVLDILEGLTQLPEDQRRARGVVARKVIDGDIKVTDRGEIDETERLRQQVKTVEAERDQARKSLDNERDESTSGSLAAQLKAAKATPPAPADTVKKDDMKSVLDKLGKAVNSEKTSAIKGSTIEGHDTVVSAFNEAADKVGATKLS